MSAHISCTFRRTDATFSPVHIQHIAFGLTLPYQFSFRILLLERQAIVEWLKNAENRTEMQSSVDQSNVNAHEFHFAHPIRCDDIPRTTFIHWRCSFYLAVDFRRPFVCKIMHIHFIVASAHSPDFHSLLNWLIILQLWRRRWRKVHAKPRSPPGSKCVSTQSDISFVKDYEYSIFRKFILNVSRVKNLIKSIFFATASDSQITFDALALLLFGKSSVSFDSFVQWKFLCNRPVYRSLLHSWHSWNQ